MMYIYLNQYSQRKEKNIFGVEIQSQSSSPFDDILHSLSELWHNSTQICIQTYTFFVGDQNHKAEINKQILLKIQEKQKLRSTNHSTANNNDIQSNKQGNQNNKSRKNSQISIQMSLLDQQPVQAYKRQKLRGLRNIGNTCYLNSAIQCLAHSQELTKLLLKQRQEEESQTEKLTQSYQHVLHELWLSHNSSRAINPSKLKDQIAKFNSHFEDFQQKDSAEVLATVLDAINQETKIKSKKFEPAQNQQVIQKYSDDKLSKYFAAKHKAMNDSIITKLFASQFKTEIKCNHCTLQKSLMLIQSVKGNQVNPEPVKSVEHGFRVFDTFTILYLPIAKQQKDNFELSIDSCLQEFVKEQKLQVQNAWFCGTCNKDMASTKKTTLFELNKFLIFGLKRFKDNEKITDFVDFDFEINLFNYCTKKQSQKDKRNMIYELYGVINHSGSMKSGHYTACCKNFHDDQWHQFNDSYVTPIQKGNIVTQKAYVLLYRRKY